MESAVVVTMGGADAHGRETPAQHGIASIAPGDPAPCAFPQADREGLGRHGGMPGVAAGRGRGAATPALGFRMAAVPCPAATSWCGTGCRRHRQGRVGLCHPETRCQFRIRPRRALGLADTSGTRGLNLGQRDLRLGRLIWNETPSDTPGRVVGPGLGIVKVVSDRQAGVVGCQRESNGFWQLSCLTSCPQ